MKILHAIYSLSGASGGPIEAVKNLGLESLAQGHESEVVSLDDPSAAYLREFPLKAYALGPGSMRYGFSPRFVPWLRENARRYDLVVVNGIWQYQSFGVWRALRNSDTPYVVFTHGMLDPWFKRKYPLKHLKKWLYWPWGEYRTLRDADAVFFTSDEERILARRSFWLYKANEIVVRFGTASPLGDPERQVCVFLDRYPNLRGKRLILFMGRIHPKKGCDLVIQAFADIFASAGNWQLVLAGPDEVGWRKDLTALAEQANLSDRITWTGMISGDLKWGAIRAADAFFLPSHQENFGIVVAEALACSVPSLISDKVNIWREVQQSGAGLVALDNLDGARCLLREWSHMAETEKEIMRKRARQCFEQKFDASSASESLIRNLSAIIEGRRKCYSHTSSSDENSWDDNTAAVVSDGRNAG